ncbi:MAG: UDP-N-acetylmuramoyl-L-alanine--D-glutamate ligase [Anaerolineae bacterium]
MGESRKVFIIGLGREGMALARFLAQRGAAVTVSDLKTREELAERIEGLSGFLIRFELGGHPQSLLDADVIYVSPGVPQDIPLLVEARKRGISISSETRLFFSLCPAPIIGITGSSGKTTTATLVGQIVERAGRHTWVGGNIGSPLIEFVEEIRPEAIVVTELSSFQLENLDRSPHIACVLNITPNHLDRHKTMEAYRAAKLNILRYQGRNDYAILNRDDPATHALLPECQGRTLLFSRLEEVEEGAFIREGRIIVRWAGEKKVCERGDIRLLGDHNLENVLAACAISAAAGAPTEAMAEVCTTFAGVEHRLELVREVAGVSYYNDSIATSPGRAIAALRSFDQPIVLLAGGRGKGLPFKELAELIVQKVRYLILFGEEARAIEEAVREAGKRAGVAETPLIKDLGDLEEAVNLAAQAGQPGDVVLLSPACTSFDLYDDFAKRGEHFKDLVGKLKDG